MTKDVDPVELGRKFALRTCIFELHVRQPGFRKRVDSYEVFDGQHVDSGQFSVSKDLIDKSYLKSLEKLRTAFLEDIKSYGVKYTGITLGHGQYLINIESVETIKELVTTFESERNKLLLKFEESYDAAKNKARGDLGKYYRESDYKSFETLRKLYKIDYRFTGNQLPEQFRALNQEIVNREKNRVRLLYEESAVELRQIQRELFLDVAEHLLGILGRDEHTGKFRTFSEAKIRNFTEFLELFSHRDLTGDGDLEKIVDQARKAMEGVSPRQIKNSFDVRQELQPKIDAVKILADSLVKESGRRIDVSSLTD